MRLAAAGVRTRNAPPAPPTNGGIILLPPGPAPGNIIWAGLYWVTLFNPPPPGSSPPLAASVTLNGNPVTPEPLGTTGSPCWPEEAAVAYFADVTGFVAAGPNVVAGLDDSGGPPGVPPETEGASLVVVYESDNSSACEIIVTDGNDLIRDITQWDNPLPITCGANRFSNLYFVGGDGQEASDDQSWNFAALGDGDDFDGSDPVAPGAAFLGWDTDQQPGGWSVLTGGPNVASASSTFIDCINWVATAIEVGVSQDCRPTPVRPSTWGRLKTLYR